MGTDVASKQFKIQRLLYLLSRIYLSSPEMGTSIPVQTVVPNVVQKPHYPFQFKTTVLHLYLIVLT